MRGASIGDEDAGSLLPPTERSPLLQDRGYATINAINNERERGRIVSKQGPINGEAVTSASRGDDTNSSEIPVDIENNNLARTPSLSPSRATQSKGTRSATAQMRYIVPAVSLGVFLAAADQTIIVSSYGRIGSDLSALNLTPWIASAYFLTLTSFQPLYGKLSDIFGRKTCLLYAYTIFGIGCVLCGVAPDIKSLIAARAFQGVGGGGMSTVVSILFSDIVPLRERGLWQGIINIVYAGGAAVGAPLGGLLSETLSWRYLFLGQAPLCLLAFIAVWFALDVPPKRSNGSYSSSEQALEREPGQGWRKKLSRVDFPGAIVLVAAVFNLIFGLDRGSNTAWHRPISYGPIVASGFFFALFIYIERHIAKEPFAPGHIIFDRSLFASYLCCFFSFGAWLAVLYYLPLFYQAVDGYGATESAVRLLPAIVASVSGSLFGGIWIKLFGKYYWLTVFAYTLLAAGMAVVLLSTGLLVNNTYAISVGTVMGGFGNGIGVTSALIAIISNAAPEDQAVATACSYLFRSLGSVLGISLTATAIQQRLRDDLARRIGSGHDAAAIEQGVRQSLDYLDQLTPELRHLVRLAYGTATTSGFLLALIVSLGATVASLFIREQRLNR
ncbi:hypothetical protein LTR84_004366 [Exophiala bonariae]|uniref:Major facilitator superfamily (MFS) profile domain-containing protein n=1 Tax=Exophiala bonariae TaxID=1690606 RepID=A0AAV9N7X4_9EURO|nr:hypothetical protein LTR84_004366 [Exophiala bonariae]